MIIITISYYSMDQLFKIELLPIKFTQHQYNSIIFESTFLDIDYIGWKYEPFPITNDKVVVIDGCSFEDCIDHFNNDNSDYSLDLPIRIQISNWNKFLNSSLAHGYMIPVLVFKKEISNYDILSCVQSYFLKLCPPEVNLIFIEKLKQEFKMEVNNFDDIIEYDLENSVIKNFVPTIK